MTSHKPVLTSLLLALISASPLLAAETPEITAAQTQLFGHPVGKTKARACFRRTYDAAHLGLHPHQNVRAMRLLVTADPGDGSADAHTYHQLVLHVSFRRENRTFETSGDCRSLVPAPARCGIDCDGGSLDVSMKDATTMLVGIPERARIWEAGTDLEDDTGPYRKRFGSDDKLFRLERTTLDDCVGLVLDPDEKSALRSELAGKGR